MSTVTERAEEEARFRLAQKNWKRLQTAVDNLYRLGVDRDDVTEYVSGVLEDCELEKAELMEDATSDDDDCYKNCVEADYGDDE